MELRLTVVREGQLWLLFGDGRTIIEERLAGTPANGLSCQAGSEWLREDGEVWVQVQDGSWWIYAELHFWLRVVHSRTGKPVVSDLPASIRQTA
jgi:hypothetical protein